MATMDQDISATTHNFTGTLTVQASNFTKTLSPVYCVPKAGCKLGASPTKDSPIWPHDLPSAQKYCRITSSNWHYHYLCSRFLWTSQEGFRMITSHYYYICQSNLSSRNFPNISNSPEYSKPRNRLEVWYYMWELYLWKTQGYT